MLVNAIVDPGTGPEAVVIYSAGTWSWTTSSGPKVIDSSGDVLAIRAASARMVPVLPGETRTTANAVLVSPTSMVTGEPMFL